MANAVPQQVSMAQGGRQSFDWQKCQLAFDPNLAKVGTAGASAVVTVNAYANGGFILKAALFSYSADPAAASNLVITDGTTTITVYVIKGGYNQPLVFDPPQQFAANTAVTATLSAPGGSIVASLQLTGWVEK